MAQQQQQQQQQQQRKRIFLLKKDKGHGLDEFLFHRLAVDTNIWATFCMKICCQEL